VVFVVTEKGDLVALSFSNGKELWRKAVGSEVLSPPGVNQSVAVVLTAAGEIKTYDVSTGDKLWQLTTPVPVLTLRGTATPVMDDDAVYIALSNGRLLAFNATDGKLLWQYTVGVPKGTSEIERIVDILGRPVIDGTMIYVTSYQGRLLALDKVNGRPLWEKNVSSYTSPTYSVGQVYTTSEEGTLSAVNQYNGQLNWEKTTLFRRGLTAPKAWGSYVAVGDFEGVVHLFAQSDGRLVGRTKTDSDGIRAEFLLFKKMLIVFTNNGELHALRIKQKS
jgi:outer membrane protein assembly factor BamB